MRSALTSWLNGHVVDLHVPLRKRVHIDTCKETEVPERKMQQHGANQGSPSQWGMCPLAKKQLPEEAVVCTARPALKLRYGRFQTLRLIEKQEICAVALRILTEKSKNWYSSDFTNERRRRILRSSNSRSLSLIFFVSRGAVC